MSKKQLGSGFVLCAAATALLVVGCSAAGPGGADGSEALGTTEQAVTQSPLVTPKDVFGAAANYNVFVFQDLSVTPTIAGPVAAGRDISAQSFGYDTSAAGSIGVVAGRNFTGANGSVHRDLVYGGTLSLSNVGVLQGTSRKATPIDFAGEKARLTALSGTLAKLKTNSTTTIFSNATIEFRGVNPARNVFTVNGAALGDTDVLRFLVPASSTVVVNVTGSSAVFETTGMQLNGLVSSHLVWNFPQATSVRLAQSGFKGTLLAVNAAVNQSASVLDGVLIANSLVGGDNGLTWLPFDGGFLSPCPDGTANCAPGESVPLRHGMPLTCSAPGIIGTLQSNVYSSLHYATPDPAHGVCAPTFCDAAGNTIAKPTDAQLNTPPPAGSTCAAFPADTSTCPVVPSTLTTACSKDSDCSAGSVCAAQCLDAGCTNIRHACGKPAASCGGLPAQTNCDDLQLCPLPGAIGTPNLARLKGQLSTTSTPSASAQIPASDQDGPRFTYDRVDALVCAPDPATPTVTTQDVSNKPADDGNSQWGVYLTPTSGFSISPVKRTDGVGEMELSANGGVAAGGIMFGNKLEVISASVSADVTDCGVTLIGAVKLFGEAVVTWTPSAGQSFHLATDNSGGSLATPALDSQNCKTARQHTKDAIKGAREANLLARAAKEYYAQDGLTPELCRSIEFQLPNRVKDPNGQPYDCDNLQTMPPVGKIKILNAWEEEYTGETGAYADFSNSLGTAHQTIQTSGTIDVFKSPHPFNLHVLDQDIPIGPVTLNVAVEGYGSWNIMGGVQFGLGFSGDFSGAGNIVGNALKGESPNVGDIRAYGGPVITPALQTGVQCFVGVGIPGVSIGLQGSIDLLDISMPTGIVAAAMRVSTPDMRTLTGTDYAGTPLPGFAPTDYRWVTGFHWNSNLTLSELNGELDLALRVHFLFFHHTFKMKLFSWPGLTQNFTLISGGTGDTLAYANDYGKQADSVAYTPITPITDNPVKINTGGPNFPDCQVVVK